MTTWVRGGWIGKFITVNLTKDSFQVEDLSKDFALSYVGGRGFGAKIFWDRIPRGVDPLGPDNRLIFASGPLTGLPMPNSGKLAIIARSPLTGGYGDSNTGSLYMPAFKKAGMDVLIIEGRADRPVYVHVDDGKVDLRDASHLWGKGIIETDEMLRAEHGRGVLNLMIGPAGENLVKFAAISAEPGRVAGRTGMGAVMGSKKVKALVIEGSGELSVARPEELEKISREVYDLLRSSPDYQFWMRQGTMQVVQWAQENACLPVRNMRESVFEAADRINGYRMEELKVRVRSCFACGMACGHIAHVEDGLPNSSEVQVDYENVVMLGSNCGLAPLESVFRLNQVCDDLGLDTISTGSVIAFAVECFEKHLLSKQDTGGLELKFGDEDAIMALLKDIAYRRGFGNTLADGVKTAAEKIGGGSERFAMHVKGLDISGYECRAAPVMSLAYGTCDIGAHHNRAWIIAWEVKTDRLGISKAKVEKLIELQHLRSSFDMLAVCRFPMVELGLAYDHYPSLLTAATGYPFTKEDMMKSAERVWCLTRALWVRETGSYNRKMDYVPPRVLEEPLPSGPFKGMNIKPEDYDRLLSWYYELRGFDSNGIPREEKLRELGLEYVADATRR